MDFTETQAEILVNAWLLAREGKGQVLEDWAEPGRERAGRGRLARTPHSRRDRRTCWFWTPEAETALDMNALNQSAEGRQN